MRIVVSTQNGRLPDRPFYMKAKLPVRQTLYFIGSALIVVQRGVRNVAG